jgi:histidine triad (HIT) family protein
MCIFCGIIRGELPASIVYENKHVLAFLDIQPFTPGHVLIIPKIHVSSFVELPKEEAGHLIRAGQLIDQALRESSLRCEGVTIFLSDGKAANQEVDHVHLHVFPRFQGDGFEMRLEGKGRRRPGRSQLDEVAEKITDAFERL